MEKLNLIDTFPPSFKPKFRKININKNNGKIVMAYTPISFKKDNYLVAFSFCSPKDSYNKAKGQFIALQRLLSPPKFNNDGSIKKPSSYLIKKEKDICMLDSVKNLICDIIKNKKIIWAEKITLDDFR